MESFTPALLAQFQQFVAFTEYQKQLKESTSQNDSTSNHAIPPVNAQAPESNDAKIQDLKPVESAAKKHCLRTVQGDDLTSSAAESDDNDLANSNSLGSVTVEDNEAGNSSWREELQVRMGCTGNNKLFRKRCNVVAKECQELGIVLDRAFSSYPAERGMHDLIARITAVVGPKYGWDRELTRDVIRVLCFDRFGACEKQKRHRKKQHPDVGWAKRIKTERGEGFLTSGETAPNAATFSHLFAPLFRIDLQLEARDITLYFPPNASYTCFKEAVFGNHVQLAPGETFYYNARYGTEKDRELKPLTLESEFIAMLNMDPEVGVKLHVCPKAEFSEDLTLSEKTNATRRCGAVFELNGTSFSPVLQAPVLQALVLHPPVLHAPAVKATSRVSIEIKSVKKPDTVLKDDKASPEIGDNSNGGERLNTQRSSIKKEEK